MQSISVRNHKSEFLTWITRRILAEVKSYIKGTSLLLDNKINLNKNSIEIQNCQMYLNKQTVGFVSWQNSRFCLSFSLTYHHVSSADMNYLVQSIMKWHCTNFTCQYQTSLILHIRSLTVPTAAIKPKVITNWSNAMKFGFRNHQRYILGDIFILSEGFKFDIYYSLEVQTALEDNWFFVRSFCIRWVCSHDVLISLQCN